MKERLNHNYLQPATCPFDYAQGPVTCPSTTLRDL